MIGAVRVAFLPDERNLSGVSLRSTRISLAVGSPHDVTDRKQGHLRSHDE